MPLVFDAEGEYPVPVASPAMEPHVSRCLYRRSPGDEPEELGRCALTGTEQRLVTRRFPEPNLPLLGETKLFSMNKDIPCQTRYGLTGPRAVPLGRDTAAALQNALTYITGPELQGRTWCTVANGRWQGGGGRKREGRDLLIVYVVGRPVIDANIAELFAADDRLEERQFAVDAEAVCVALRGIARERPESRLALFVIRKVDDEKKQVVLTESPTILAVLDAADRWQAAVRDNLPEVTLPMPPKTTGEPAFWRAPVCPYPEQVARLLSQQWVAGGTRAAKVQGVGLGDVLHVMLRSPGRWEGAAGHMLELTLDRIGALFLGVFGTVRSGDQSRWKAYGPPARETALRAVSVLGILLDATGRRKERYMNETAFQVGRLLSLADTLHCEYCRHVRNGNIPPQLIGNALMPAAAGNPLDAIDRLRERLNVYTAWAAKSQGEDFALAKWAVGQMGQACDLLAKSDIPDKTDLAFRAELFLGYMARQPASQRKDTQSQE